MQNLQRTLQDVANARRRELIPYVYDNTNGQVQLGPFKGMIIIPHVMWGDGDTVAKLMGVYEDELHGFIEDAVTRKPDAVINIGSAEGYYSIGMARRLPETPVIAVDIDQRANKIVTDNAAANSLKNVTAVTQKVDTQWLRAKCQEYSNALLILDCEGAEIELLDDSAIPELSYCSILVECHDCIIPGITQTLTHRFEKTHKISKVDQMTKDPYQFAWCHSLSDCDKWALVHEGRPSTMSWLYLTPNG